MNEEKRLCDSVLRAIPISPPDIIEWAEHNVLFPSSARSKHFNISVSPWLREPLTRAADSRTRIVTMMKPVQSGGSAFGEVLLLYWIMFSRGFLQYNWSNGKRAGERWDSRIDAILKSCQPVALKMNAAELNTKGDVNFGNVFLRMQGAFNPDNLDSDSVPLQINEEVHSWEAGHLQKARNRQTAVWNYKGVDISNAGVKGDQLDQAFSAGTGQRWEVKCPGCGEYHQMRTRWEDDKPHLGGLRYDANGCRLGKFEYNYSKLRPTIRFQMPCGLEIASEDIRTRRALSLSGRYTEPLHEGAELSHRSYTYEAVAVDYIDWMQLIKEKHEALRARALGDPEPFRRYKCERECIPYDPADVPIVNNISTTKGLRKSHEGLPEPKIRLFALDRQQGEVAKGDSPHWWLVIRDVTFNGEKGKIQSRLVFEDRLNSDEDVISILNSYECNMWQGVADSGDDTRHVYEFCMKYGINAIKGGKTDFYSHEDGARRIFSQERPLHLMINAQPMFSYIELGGKSPVKVPDPREPMFWLYSKDGIRERLYWMQTDTIYETPMDVSEAYKHHLDAEERVYATNPSDGSRFWKWVQRKPRNDLFVCEAYIAMQVDQAGAAINSMIIKEPETAS